MQARHTCILWVEEELTSRIESASFTPSHLGYLLSFFFFSLSKSRIRERDAVILVILYANTRR